MKKSFLLALCAVAALSLFSCSENLVETEVEQYERKAGMVEKTFTGCLETDTKTSFSDYTGRTSWSKTDVINIVGATTNTSATASNLNSTRTHATFKATVTEGEQLYAYYPYTDGVSVSDEKVSFSIPSSQDGTFASANMAASKAADDGIFYFRNATTVLQFTVDVQKYPKAAKVRVQSQNSNNKMTGSFFADFSDDSFSVYRDPDHTSGTNYVSADISSLNGDASKIAYISIAPGEYSSGIKFTIQTAGGQTIRTVTFSNSLLCEPGQLYAFGDLSEHLDEYVFFDTEEFSAAAGTGGRSGGFARPNNPITDADAVCDYDGWNLSYCQEANGCICIGDGSHDAYAITPPLGISTGSATLSFSAVNTTSSSALILLYVEGNGYVDKQVVSLTSGTWTTFTVGISGADANTKIKFATNIKEFAKTVTYPNSYFLDDVKVIDGCTDFAYMNLSTSHVFIEANETGVFIPASSNASVTTSQVAGFTTYFDNKTGLHVMSLPVNETQETRRFDVTIRVPSVSDPDNAERNFFVYQYGKTKVTASPETLEFPYAGGTLTSALTLWNFASDREITVRSSNSQFTASVEGTTISVTAAENTGEDALSGEITVTVSDGERERTCTITVSQAAPPVVTVDPTSLAFTNAGGTDTVAVTTKNFDEAGLEISAASDNDALTVAVNGSEVYVTAAANTAADAVSGTVTITVTDGTETVSVDVPVTVAGAPSVSVDPATLGFLAEGETETATLTISNFASGYTVTAVSDNEQFTATLSGTTLSVTAAENTSSDVLTGTVTVTVTDGVNTRSCDVALTQEGAILGPVDQELEFSATAVNAYYGTAFTEPTLSGAHTTVTYSIVSAAGAATIDANTGEVTINAVNGTATVTATALADDDYNMATASYTITVYRLPAAYTEQEYITGNADKYIATGIVFNQSSRIVFDYQATIASDAGYLYGSMTTNASNSSGGVGEDMFVLNIANSSYYKYGSVRVSATLNNTNRHVVDHNGTSVTLDGTLVHTFEAETFTCPGQMYLLWANYSKATLDMAQAKLYSCQMYADGTTLSRDYVPCTKVSTSEEGLYDMVSATFFPLREPE